MLFEPRKMALRFFGFEGKVGQFYFLWCCRGYVWSSATFFLGLPETREARTSKKMNFLFSAVTFLHIYLLYDYFACIFPSFFLLFSTSEVMGVACFITFVAVRCFDKEGFFLFPGESKLNQM